MFIFNFLQMLQKHEFNIIGYRTMFTGSKYTDFIKDFIRKA